MKNWKQSKDYTEAKIKFARRVYGTSVYSLPDAMFEQEWALSQEFRDARLAWKNKMQDTP